MAVKTAHKCIRKAGDEVGAASCFQYSPPHVPPWLCRCLEQWFCWGASIPLGGAAPSSFCVRCPYCQLQSGLLIKPHETNKSLYWPPQAEPECALGPCTARRVGWSLKQKQGRFAVPAYPVPPTHFEYLMWSGLLLRLEQAEPDVTEKHTQS